MQLLTILGTIGFFLWLIRNISFWVALFQIKEYRRDRLMVHLTETKQGKKVLFSVVSLIKWLLLGAFMVSVFVEGITTWLTVGVFMLYTYEGCVVLSELFFRRFKRPTITGKSFIISFISFLCLALLFCLPLVGYGAWMIFLDRVTLLIISIFVFFFAFPTELYVDLKIRQAHQRMRKYPQIIVIAVSGSYGKSSTKEYIAQILSSKFIVVKTVGSNNTAIGIAKTILQKITAKTEVFVVEMGAYKKGEIAQLAAMVPPTISVTTSVSDQHLSLFGSVENAMETEMELIHALSKNGLALFNGNNSNTLALFSQTDNKKSLYLVGNSNGTVKPTINATNLQVTKDGIRGLVTTNKETFPFFVPLLGKHMIENVLPAIYIALKLGIPKKSIISSLSQLTPPDKTMMARTGEDGVTLVDDTFNASPESVSAAMEYMQVYKHKKIYVLTPLIELGKHAKSRHEEIGFEAGTKCDYLFLTNNNFYDDIMQGIMLGNGNCIVTVDKPLGIAKQIHSLAKRGDVIVYEGKESGLALKKYI